MLSCRSAAPEMNRHWRSRQEVDPCQQGRELALPLHSRLVWLRCRLTNHAEEVTTMAQTRPVHPCVLDCLTAAMAVQTEVGALVAEQVRSERSCQMCTA